MKETILEEAQRLVGGDRQSAYGPPSQHFASVALAWSAIIGVTISPAHVPLCMAALKLVREAHVPKRDNRVDASGYMLALDLMTPEG